MNNANLWLTQQGNKQKGREKYRKENYFFFFLIRTICVFIVGEGFVLYCFYFLVFDFWFFISEGNVRNLWGCGASVCCATRKFPCVVPLSGWPSWNRRDHLMVVLVQLSLSLSTSFSLYLFFYVPLSLYILYVCL